MIVSEQRLYARQWLDLFRAWWNHFQDSPVTVNALCDRFSLDGGDCPINLPREVLGPKRMGPGSLRRSLGRRLARLTGSTVGEFLLCDAGADTNHHVRMWRLLLASNVSSPQTPHGTQATTPSPSPRIPVSVDDMLRTHHILDYLRGWTDLPALCEQLGLAGDSRDLRAAIIRRSASQDFFGELTSRTPRELIPAAERLWMSSFVHYDRPAANLRRLRAAVRGIDRLTNIFRVATEGMCPWLT